jgi:hypothetical protein
MNARFARHLIEAASDPSSRSSFIVLFRAPPGNILKVFPR